VIKYGKDGWVYFSFSHIHAIANTYTVCSFHQSHLYTLMNMTDHYVNFRQLNFRNDSSWTYSARGATCVGYNGIPIL